VASSVFSEENEPRRVRPIIGLTTYIEDAQWGRSQEEAALLPQAYVDAVARSGGFPILLPPSSVEPEDVLGTLDGLVITGGPDVDPAHYGADPHVKTRPARIERDGWEMALGRAALDEDLPLLAICRGLQILNVAMGGSLHQHLPEIVGHEDHRFVEGEKSPTLIALNSGCLIGGILGSEAEGICHHHQAIDRLGRRMEAVGFAADGTVEAVEVAGQEFAIGVQWHPEDDPTDDRLFTALVQAAARYRFERRGDPEESRLR
jgi:anthranilate synthase component 2/putative glutamine amidotransferase